MRTTNLKVSSKKKVFILAGQKLFQNIVNSCWCIHCYCTLVRMVPAICMIDWTNVKMVLLQMSRVVTNYKLLHDSLLTVIVFWSFSTMWLWAVLATFWRNITVEAVYSIEIWTAQPTVKWCKILKTGSVLSRCSVTDWISVTICLSVPLIKTV